MARLTCIEQAFAAYDKPLQRYLARRLRDRQEAQDLAQEVFARLLRVPDRELVRAPHAYLFKIASNLVYERVMRDRRQGVIFDSRVADHAAEWAGDSDALDHTQALYTEQQLNSVLAQLRPLDAAILVLKKRDGYSLAEIASELHISIHTVKKYLCRALVSARCANWSAPW